MDNLHAYCKKIARDIQTADQENLSDYNCLSSLHLRMIGDRHLEIFLAACLQSSETGIIVCLYHEHLLVCVFLFVCLHRDVSDCLCHGLNFGSPLASPPPEMRLDCLPVLNFSQDWDWINETQNNLPTQLLECELSREVSEKKTVRVQNESPQHVPQWYADCFEQRKL